MNTGQQPLQSAQGSAGGTSASGPASGSVADKTLLVPYVLEPPRWRAPLIANKSPSLYPDFFPGATALYPQSTTQSGVHVPGISRDSSHAGNGPAGAHFVPVAGVTASKEDELSETVAKLGFVNKAVVQTENFSAHALIHNKLHNGPSIHALGKIVQRVLERQKNDDSLLPNPGPWTYKPPSKVVYNASRLETWYSELANPSVPLSKLAKTIPSAPSSSSQGMTATGTGTYTGSSSVSASTASSGSKITGNAMDRNLDMLTTRQVPKDRALWFLQAVGQNEISQLSKSKNLQLHPILTYSGDFTVALVESLKRQIGEALLPLTQTTGTGRLLPGMSVKGRPRNILAEEHNKDRWLNKWNYTLELLNACLEEGMLDRQRLCSLLLQNLQPHSRVQMLWWLAVILHTSIDDMLDTAWMSKDLVTAVFEWLSSLGSPLSDEDLSYAECEEIGHGLLRHIWLTDSEMFLIPQLWARDSDRLRLKLYLGINDPHSDDESLWNDLADRVDALLCLKMPDAEKINDSSTFHPPVKQEINMLRSSKSWHIDAQRIVSLLDGWQDSQSISSLTKRLFGHSPSSRLAGEPLGSPGGAVTQISSDACHEVVRLLLMWATTTTRGGRHRPYLAASILREHVGLAMYGGTSGLYEFPGDGLGRPDADSFEDLQISLMEWMDTQEAYLSKVTQECPQLQWTTRLAVLHMCQILLKWGLLEIGGLVQKVIARGYISNKEAHDSAQRSIYSLLLQEYKGRSQQRALRWQMVRVSLSDGGADVAGAVAKIREDCSQMIEPLLQSLRARAGESRTKITVTQLSTARDYIKTLSVFKRANLVDDWLLPAVKDALKQNVSRVIDSSTFLSVWWLLDEIDMPEAQVQFSNSILQDFPTCQDVVLAIISAREVHSSTLSLCGHPSVYATSLLSAFLTLSKAPKEPPATQILSELVKLGSCNHLNTSQLQTLRAAFHSWPLPPRTPTVISSMLSPPNTDKCEADVLRELSVCLQTYVERYVSPQVSWEDLAATLTNITSIYGTPIDFFGAFIPATLHLLSGSNILNDTQISALCFLASTLGASAAGDVKRTSSISDLLPCVMNEMRWHFKHTHAQFLQKLLIDNITSLHSFVTNVCHPMLVDMAETSWSHESASNFIDMISTILIKAPDTGLPSWRLAFARIHSYHQSHAFERIVTLAERVSLAHKQARTSQATYTEQLASLYFDLISASATQELLVKHVSQRGKSWLGSEETLNQERVVWDILSQCIKSWSRIPYSLKPPATGDDALTMTAILDASTFTPLVAPFARLYCKHLLKRLDEGRETESREGEAFTGSKRWTFASRCLAYILESTGEEQQEHIEMFADTIGSQLYAVGLDALSAKLQGNVVSVAMVEPTTLLRDRQMTQLVRTLERLSCLTRTRTPTAQQSHNAIRLLRAIAATLSRQDPATQLDSEVRPSEVSHLARMVCLAMSDVRTSSEELDAIERCAAAFIQHLRKTSTEAIHDRRLRDTLAWLVHFVGPLRRRRLLEPLQGLLLLGVDEFTHLLDRKLILLGPHPPFSYLSCQDAYFISLQRTWAGMAANDNAHAEIDLKSNNEPLDLHKYQYQTHVIQRHIQPANRSEPSSGWGIFDSEIPWDQSTTFQRDFRRATITLPDILQGVQQQSLRNRTISQTDVGRAQAARLPALQAMTEGPKQVHSKEKSSEQTGASKKRKNVPDVIVIDENSPKKKSKTTSNVTSTAHPAKNQKKK